jgi:hypothetical protein
VGDLKRIAFVTAERLVHFWKRVEAMDGKVMIGCMSRRILVDLLEYAFMALQVGAATPSSRFRGRARRGRRGSIG